MLQRFKQMLGDEDGQGLAEYGLILSLVAVACIGATRALGTKVSGTMTTAGNGMP